jgi:hypothetical protein
LIGWNDEYYSYVKKKDIRKIKIDYYLKKYYQSFNDDKKIVNDIEEKYIINKESD